ncbi:hypothetical protein [Virgibacillus halodenitrificans]|uniref:Uncharacterized protein n=1 Tax=Virgibacillus halodenitrificans TaxID=1482 RepID=A0ABR7VNA6_VIRHA|nr:hypothetical protein [Virgibacillus halodenitrificans]MBD1222786.1 hypothetical protein [Virgibacillus halodenitrificans]
MPKQINYEIVAKNLIDSLLGDWLKAVTFKENLNQLLVTNKLAKICYYDGLPVKEVLDIAKKRNEIFYFLPDQIDIHSLQSELENKIEKLKEISLNNSEK